ncbi:MAG: hypothetical protein PHY39_07475, partial [Endomicrobiaceae bacterium]|nr:hypothetical protein [Endomicrobiaceae bacterium]
AGLADGSVTTNKIADANVTSSKLTQSDYGNVYKIKVDTATYAINATTATYVLGAGLPDGSVTETKIAADAVTTIKILNANVTPAKLTQSDYTNAYKIKVDTATYAINATTAVNATTATYVLGAGLPDGSVTETKIAADAVTTIKILNANVTPAKLTQSDYGNVYKIKVDTSTYATSAGTASNLSNGVIESAHFKYEGDYGHIYDIKVSSAEFVESIGADLAEIYASSEILEPGDVVSISATKDNSIEKTRVADDTMIAGVISTEPGLLMNTKEKGYKLALVGKVPTKVCNEGGNIKRGDMLVSASIAGYAKKASDQPKTGTVIGKALENFDSPKGTILVLVNLQ